ncbi:MAG: Hsp70 family protein [Candidatus Latescibacterota bacterium]
MATSDIYGLDFGTSNSAISVLSDGHARMLPIAQDAAETIPTLLFFPDYASEACIGERAIQEYVEGGMKGRLMQSIKSFLPDVEYHGTPIGGKYGFMTIEHFVALIIEDIKKRADRLTGQDIKRVVLGRPVVFSDKPEEDVVAEKRLIKAAERAGFKEIYLQQEPIAAAFEYEQQLTKDETALIVDLGGGTSDFTIIKLGPNRFAQHDREHDILGVHGFRLGGNDFDADIMWNNGVRHFGKDATYTEMQHTLPIPNEILLTLCTWQKMSLLKEPRTKEFLKRLIKTGSDPQRMKNLNTLVNENLGYSFFQSVEAVKCALSQSDEAMLLFDQSGIQVHETITKIMFEEMVKKKVIQLDEGMDHLLKQCALSPQNIDSVFTTGGTSSIPCIRNLIAHKFGADKIKSGNTFLSVATGLALSGKQFI